MATILVIDDETTMLGVMADILSDAGHDVRSFIKGSEALRSFDEKSCDLLVADLIMPETDGMQLLLALRDKKPDLKCLMVSGGGAISADEHLEMAREMGHVDTLKKPFDSAAFLDKVNRLLDS